MKEAKFTKAPWVIIECDFASEVEITTDNRQETSKGKICEMDIYFDGSHGIEQPASAHLIATSPELYEFIETHMGGHPEAEALLAKARGEL